MVRLAPYGPNHARLSPGGGPSMACAIPPKRVDSTGPILDDGSSIVRPWIGRHYRELPRSAKVIMGVDPRAV